MGAVQMERVRGVGRGGMELRWYFVALVTAAIAISYFDRQTLPVAISAIQRNIPISNQQFSYLQTSFLLAYAALYAIGGRLLDRLGLQPIVELGMTGEGCGAAAAIGIVRLACEVG